MCGPVLVSRVPGPHRFPRNPESRAAESTISGRWGTEKQCHCVRYIYRNHSPFRPLTNTFSLNLLNRVITTCELELIRKLTGSKFIYRNVNKIPLASGRTLYLLLCYLLSPVSYYNTRYIYIYIKPWVKPSCSVCGTDTTSLLICTSSQQIQLWPKHHPKMSRVWCSHLNLYYEILVQPYQSNYHNRNNISLFVTWPQVTYFEPTGPYEL